MLSQIARLDAHHRLGIGLGVALLTYLVASRLVIWPISVLIVYVSYALTINVLAWVSMTYLLPYETPQTYRIQDSSRLLVLFFTLSAAVASLFAVLFLLNSVKNLNPVHLKAYVALSIATVISSWLLVHTLFTLRYAHLYYEQDPAGGHPAGGLNFPDNQQPDYIDFAYVAFGVGMTSQVADVGPTTTAFRRLILTHSLLSFGFNTLIVALSINIMASLL